MIFISEGVIEYTGTSKKIGLYLSCKPFKLKKSDIKYIILSPRLIIDDEECFLVFIDKKDKKFILPLFHTSNIDLIESFCEVSLSGDTYFEKFTYEDHYGKVDKIVYPKHLYWKDLYKKDWKLFVKGFYSWINPKSFFGSLIEY